MAVGVAASRATAAGFHEHTHNKIMLHPCTGTTIRIALPRARHWRAGDRAGASGITAAAAWLTIAIRPGCRARSAPASRPDDAVMLCLGLAVMLGASLRI